jgi:hypothetical protein
MTEEPRLRFGIRWCSGAFRLSRLSLFRQFAEPMQRDRGLRIIHFMTAVESPDSNSLEAGPFDGTYNIVLLFYRRNPIIPPRTNVDRRVQKTCPWLEPRISVTQVVFVRAGDVNSDDTTTVSREKRSNITNAFSSAGEPRACDRPLLRTGKTAMKCIDGGHCHGLTPCHIVVPRLLGAIARQQHPAFGKADPPIKVDQVIPILTFKITGGTDYQNRPGFCRIKICRRCEHGHCVWRHGVATLPGV